MTPTYWIFRMYRDHMGASRKNGRTTLTLANLFFDQTKDIEIGQFSGNTLAATATMTLLGGAPYSHNTFDLPGTVTASPVSVNDRNGTYPITMPPASVVWDD